MNSTSLRRLPTFLLIGVNRSGTTSLYRYLSAHPEIFMAKGKELRFFSEHWDKGVEWYSQYFKEVGSEKHLGEATPSYFHCAEAPLRVASVIPEAKLIVSLRHPVERLYSMYWMHVERGLVKGSFEEVVSHELNHDGGPYLDQSKYVEHFMRWDEHFDKAQYHVSFFDNLSRDPVDEYLSICTFLNAEPCAPEVVGRVINNYRGIRFLPVRRFARKLPKPLKNAIGRINSVSTTYPALGRKTREKLLSFFRPYNLTLEDRLGVSLPDGWFR